MPRTRPDAARAHSISQAAELSGVPAATIRFYEAQGLLDAPARAANGYRVYGPAELRRLRFIQRCRTLDMSLDEVRALLDLELGGAHADATLAAHIGHVRARIAELRGLERELAALRARCDGARPGCSILQALHEQADTPPPAGRAHRTPQAKRHV